MEVLEIQGDNRFDTWSKRRVACRGIVVNENKVLLSYETATGQYGIPGGGVEANESYEECCAREIAEETGVVVSVEELYLTVREFYEDYVYESYYFICRAVGKTQRKLTPREQKVGMVHQWVDIQNAEDIFSGYQQYAKTDEERRGIYLREYSALLAYTKAADKM